MISSPSLRCQPRFRPIVPVVPASLCVRPGASGLAPALAPLSGCASRHWAVPCGCCGPPRRGTAGAGVMMLLLLLMTTTTLPVPFCMCVYVWVYILFSLLVSPFFFLFFPFPDQFPFTATTTFVFNQLAHPSRCVSCFWFSSREKIGVRQGSPKVVLLARIDSTWPGLVMVKSEFLAAARGL